MSNHYLSFSSIYSSIDLACFNFELFLYNIGHRFCTTVFSVFVAAGTIFVCVKKSPIIPTYAALIVGYIIIRAAVKIKAAATI